MGTQFFGSLLGVGIAVGVLGLMSGYYAYKRWYKKESIEIKGEVVTIISIFVLLGAISGYKLIESSYYYAKKGTNYAMEAGEYGTKAVLDAGQHAISGTIKYFSVAVLEGVGQTYDHFEKKWDKEKIKHFNDLKLEIISVDKKVQQGRAALHLILKITNVSDKAIDFEALITHQLLLLKSKNSTYYPVTFNGALNHHLKIPAGTTVEQAVDILVEDGNYPTMLATPQQQLKLQ